jgi:hypothetical protein
MSEMSDDVTLSFWVKKCSFNILRPHELTDEGKKILELSTKADTASFEECKELLKDNINVMYLPGNAYELEDVFEDAFDEIEVEDFEIEEVYPAEGNTIYFSISGKFSVSLNRAIASEDELRAVEEEFDGHFDHGVQVDFDFFQEEFEGTANDGDLSFSGHDGLGVRHVS